MCVQGKTEQCNSHLWDVVTLDARNRRRHGEVGLPIRQAVLWVCDTAFDLWQMLHPQKEQSPRVLPRWKPPEERLDQM